MAHGKPVVAFPVGGIPEWCSHEESGLLVPHKDVAAMARAIERLLDDRSLAGRLGERGRTLVSERFPREAHLAGLEAALAAALAG
jgi:glycosyltransferase involved in cell wall biosynthesis